MKTNGLALIKQRLSSMSPVEKRIAACILQDPDRAVNSTIGRLAADAGVAVSSVVNFAVSLGFKGFAELKINMAQNLAGSGEPERLPEALEGDPRRALRHIISAAMVSFEDTWQALGDELSQAAELLMAASRVEIYGEGEAASLAMEAHYRLRRLGLPADFIQDPLCAGISASELPADGCALAISHTGRTSSVLLAAEQARARGAKVIVLTSFAVSPLTRLADVSLLAVSGEAKAYHEALAARMTKLLLLDGLCACIEERMAPEAAERQRREMDAMETNMLRK